MRGEGVGDMGVLDQSLLELPNRRLASRIKRASNLSPIVSKGLIAAAEEAGIAYTLEADSHTTGTDADAIQSRRAGIATGVVSYPNRHMHSSNESVDLEDLENCAPHLRLRQDARHGLGLHPLA